VDVIRLAQSGRVPIGGVAERYEAASCQKSGTGGGGGSQNVELKLDPLLVALLKTISHTAKGLAACAARAVAPHIRDECFPDLRCG
jgi:hypothetical protein